MLQALRGFVTSQRCIWAAMADSMNMHLVTLVLLTLLYPLASAQAQEAEGQAARQDLPPGLEAARLLPGWTDRAGNRVLALELQLQPGWKTYWRSPGDTGLPPHFEWEGSQNLSGVTFHWPAPEAIRSGERLEMGYHNHLVLPFTAHAVDPALPITVKAQIDLGLCENICVPGQLNLMAPKARALADPAIRKALEAEPVRLQDRPACHVTPITDGLRVLIGLPGPDATLAAVELTDRPDVWVSGADLVQGPEGPQAAVEMVGPTGQPFALDHNQLRLTVVSGQGAGASAVEMLGCEPSG